MKTLTRVAICIAILICSTGAARGEGIGGRFIISPQIGGIVPIRDLSREFYLPTAGDFHFGSANNGYQLGLAIEYRLLAEFAIGGRAAYGYLPIKYDDEYVLYDHWDLDCGNTAGWVETGFEYTVRGNYSLVEYGLYLSHRTGKLGPFTFYVKAEISSVRPSVSYKVDYIQAELFGRDDFEMDVDIDPILSAQFGFGIIGRSTDRTGYFFEVGLTRLFSEDKVVVLGEDALLDSTTLGFDAEWVSIKAGLLFHFGSM